MKQIDLRQLFQQEVSASEVEKRITAREVVRQCLPEIRRSRKQKLSWDRISEIVKAIVKQGYDTDLHLTGNTVRYYYYEFFGKKRKKYGASSRSSAQRTRSPKAQPSTIEALPQPKPEEGEQVKVVTSVASADKELAKEGASLTMEPNESSQSNPYQRPPGSRFTKGHKVKYWNGGKS